MKLGDTIFNGNQFKNVILNSTSYKRLILGGNLVWSYFSIAIKSFKTRVLADAGTYEGESILEDRLQEITPNLFDSASLVITPNGVKTSKLYTIKPNDGTGDLTVTRNTSATRIDENGNIVNVPANVARIDYSKGSPAILVEPQRTNLLLRSEEFDNAYWFKGSISTVTPNLEISPYGTVTADRISPTISNNNHAVHPNSGTNVTIGTSYTASIYVKKGNQTYCGLEAFWNASKGAIAFFNLQTKTLIYSFSQGVNYSISNAKITDFNNEWLKLEATFTFGDSIAFIGVCMASTQWTTGTSYNNTYIGNTSDFLYIWGAQLEAGSNATSYIPTTTSSVTRNADVISKTGLSGITSITENFENGTTNVISGNPTSYTMSQGRIKHVIGL